MTLIGLGAAAVTVWNIAKWPVLIVLVSLMFALLYWASPNARHGGFRWISPGGIVAVLIWLVVSGGFAFYVGNFGSYNKTYGALAGVIIFLVWLWLTNLAILLRRASSMPSWSAAGRSPPVTRSTRSLTSAARRPQAAQERDVAGTTLPMSPSGTANSRFRSES